MRNPPRILLEIPKGTDITGELLVAIRTILKLILKEQGWRLSA
jgi:hypothetical protein